MYNRGQWTFITGSGVSHSLSQLILAVAKVVIEITCRPLSGLSAIKVLGWDLDIGAFKKCFRGWSIVYLAHGWPKFDPQHPM